MAFSTELSTEVLGLKPGEKLRVSSEGECRVTHIDADGNETVLVESGPNTNTEIQE